jgi:hypothetical protein
MQSKGYGSFSGGDRYEKVENRDPGDASQHRNECVGNDFEEGIGFGKNSGG